MGRIHVPSCMCGGQITTFSSGFFLSTLFEAGSLFLFLPLCCNLQTSWPISIWPDFLSMPLISPQYCWSYRCMQLHPVGLGIEFGLLDLCSQGLCLPSHLSNLEKLTLSCKMNSVCVYGVWGCLYFKTSLLEPKTNLFLLTK